MIDHPMYISSSFLSNGKSQVYNGSYCCNFLLNFLPFLEFNSKVQPSSLFDIQILVCSAGTANFFISSMFSLPHDFLFLFNSLIKPINTQTSSYMIYFQIQDTMLLFFLFKNYILYSCSTTHYTLTVSF